MVLRDALNSNERQFVFTSFFDGAFYDIHDSTASEINSSCFPHFTHFSLLKLCFSPLWNQIRKQEENDERKAKRTVNVIALHKICRVKNEPLDS